MGDEKKDQVEQKQKSFWEKLVEYHAVFLETIKSVYPLGVLSSLSITTAAFIFSFREESLVLAQTYATTAALLFLTAFASSFVLKLFLLLPENPPTEYFGHHLLRMHCIGGGFSVPCGL